MPLPTGAWNINSNGQEGSLVIDGVSATGVVGGEINVHIGGERITGFWDETSQELTFSPLPQGLPQESPVLPILYKGYLFSTPLNPVPGQDIVWTLAGSFQSVDTGGAIPQTVPANARRNIFGWFAQTTAIT